MAGMRSAMRSPMRSALDQALGTAYMSLANQALAILRKFGTDAHVYLPGANGVAVSGLLTNNYTLSDGSTGYNAVDGTAGLVLDGAGSVGAERVTNGGFDVDLTGWTNIGGAQSWSAGALRRTPGGAASGSYQEFATTANQTYLLTGNANPISGTGAQQVVAYQGGGFATQLGATSASVSGQFQFFFVATSATTRVYLYSDGTKVVDYDAISCKQVTGIHATQATTANKPALRRGLYNLLTYSNDLSNAAWTKSGGSISGVKFTPSTGSAAYKTVQHSTIAAATTPTTVFALVEPAGYSVASIVLSGSNGRWVVDLSTSASTDYGGSGSLTIADVGSGRKLIAFAVTTGASVGAPWVGCQPTVSDPAIASTADGTSGINIYATGMTTGLYTAAQILAEGGIPLTTSAAASNAGAGRYWWQFDGTNDQLVCATAPFQIADDFAIVVAVNANTIAGFPGVLAVDDGGSTNAVALYLNSGVPTAYVMAGGTLQAAIAGPAITAGSAYVLSIVKTGSSLKIRKNGVDGTTISTVGVGSAAFNAMRIGYQAIGLAYWIGAIGEPMFIKGTVSASDVLTLERQVASTFPAGPSF